MGMLVPLLAGCTSEDPDVRDERLRWANQALPSERAGALDALDSGRLSAQNAWGGTLSFEEVPAGRYDVYIACRGGWRIDVTITGERGVELGATSLLCDAATAIEVEPATPGLRLTATAPNEDTDWAVLVLPVAENEEPPEQNPEQNPEPAAA